MRVNKRLDWDVFLHKIKVVYSILVMTRLFLYNSLTNVFIYNFQKINNLWKNLVLLVNAGFVNQNN